MRPGFNGTTEIEYWIFFPASILNLFGATSTGVGIVDFPMSSKMNSPCFSSWNNIKHLNVPKEIGTKSMLSVDVEFSLAKSSVFYAMQNTWWFLMYSFKWFVFELFDWFYSGYWLSVKKLWICWIIIIIFNDFLTDCYFAFGPMRFLTWIGTDVTW